MLTLLPMIVNVARTCSKLHNSSYRRT